MSNRSLKLVKIHIILLSLGLFLFGQQLFGEHNRFYSVQCVPQTVYVKPHACHGVTSPVLKLVPHGQSRLVKKSQEPLPCPKGFDLPTPSLQEGDWVRERKIETPQNDKKYTYLKNDRDLKKGDIIIFNLGESPPLGTSDYLLVYDGNKENFDKKYGNKPYHIIRRYSDDGKSNPVKGNEAHQVFKKLKKTYGYEGLNEYAPAHKLIRAMLESQEGGFDYVGTHVSEACESDYTKFSQEEVQESHPEPTQNVAESVVEDDFEGLEGFDFSEPEEVEKVEETPEDLDFSEFEPEMPVEEKQPVESVESKQPLQENPPVNSSQQMPRHDDDPSYSEGEANLLLTNDTVTIDGDNDDFDFGDFDFTPEPETEETSSDEVDTIPAMIEKLKDEYVRVRQKEQSGEDLTKKEKRIKEIYKLLEKQLSQRPQKQELTEILADVELLHLDGEFTELGEELAELLGVDVNSDQLASLVAQRHAYLNGLTPRNDFKVVEDKPIDYDRLALAHQRQESFLRDRQAVQTAIQSERTSVSIPEEATTQVEPRELEKAHQDSSVELVSASPMPSFERSQSDVTVSPKSEGVEAPQIAQADSSQNPSLVSSVFEDLERQSEFSSIPSRALVSAPEKNTTQVEPRELEKAHQDPSVELVSASQTPSFERSQSDVTFSQNSEVVETPQIAQADISKILLWFRLCLKISKDKVNSVVFLQEHLSRLQKKTQLR